MKRQATDCFGAFVAGIALSVFAFSVQATTDMWYPSTAATFSGWPTNWVAIPSLNDPKDQTDANARIDFVGDSQNPGAYWSSDSNYFFIRMRVAVSNVTSTTFHDAHWIYIDRVDYTNGSVAAGMPDYAIVWDSKSNDPTKHGLELQTGTNISATTYWSQLSLGDIDGNPSQKVSPPDFNLSGDGYIRTIDMQPTTNFGYTTYIDFAVKWSFISANTALGTNQTWRFQFGSRNDANDHNFPQDDIAGGFLPSSAIASSWANGVSLHPLSASITVKAYATAGGVKMDLWTISEAGHDDIVVYAWTGNQWVEVGRVPGSEVVGEGSNHYSLQAQGLAEGTSYLLKVRDEAGIEHTLFEPTTVKSIRMNGVQFDSTAMTLSFNTEYGRRYVVKVSESPFAAADKWTVENVIHPTANGWSALTDQPFMAGQGSKTSIRLPVTKYKTAFFKIVLIEE